MFEVTINGTRIDQVLRKVFVQRKEMLHVATVNPEFVMEAKRNDRFRNILAQTDLKVADGWGIVWAARLLGRSPIQRITGTELVGRILLEADSRGEKIFLLGAQPGVAAKAGETMRNKYRNAVFSWYEGAKTIKLEKDEESSMTIAKINAFQPDYLLVAYGSPWQDIWIEENRPYLRARVAIGVGGVLDEWAGIVPVSPVWLDKMGGKWLFRLVTQPWRLGRIWQVGKFGGRVLRKWIVDILVNR